MSKILMFFNLKIKKFFSNSSKILIFFKFELKKIFFKKHPKF